MIRLGVPDLISNSYFPAIAAVDLGFFKAEGLDAEVQLVFPVPRTMAELREGKLDFVAGAAHATLGSFPEWRGAKLLGALAQRMYWFLVLRADLKADRGDLSSVNGLRIGAAPGPDAGLRRLLLDSGVDPERNGVQIGPIPGASDRGASFGVSAAQALEAGSLDGFWANGMGAEVAVRRGVGTVVLDVRRGDGPSLAQHYTFPALITTDQRIRDEPETAAAALRAIVRTQHALRDDPDRATEVGRRLFPPMEADLIADLIRRDLPYYDPHISHESVAALNRFTASMKLASGEAAYDDVVATQFGHIWDE
ncbi:MAG: putative ABC-type nitrate/sulfonate/bicarbonate transport system periplasmic component [Chloroflexi bacterium]|nr:putative ABC-type nitrate/sulfonate/bicarbonate transport system periplasmic component [Chloroflexota bacterium]